MPYRLCEKQLMEQPVEQPYCYCDFRLCGNKKKALYKYSNEENTLYTISILVIYQKIQNVNHSVYKFRIRSNLFDSPA